MSDFYKWLLFDVLFPVSPMVIRILLNIFAHTNLNILDESEIFFYGIILCTVAIIQRKGNTATGVIVKTICYICTTISFIFMTVIYMGVNTQETLYLSIFIAIISLVTSFLSMCTMKKQITPGYGSVQRPGKQEVAAND